MYAATGIISATAFFGNGENLSDIIAAKLAGVTIREENIIVGTEYQFSELNFVGDYVTATGIGSTATLTFVTPPYSEKSGISTYADNAGIATYADNAGIATFASIAGIATNAITAGTATTATNINISATSTGDTTTHVVLVGDNTTGGQQPFIDNGSLTYNGSTNVLTAGGFNGDGSALTALNASQLTSGTIPGDRGVTSGSTSSSFIEYNGTTKTAGQFDGGTTDPTSTTRLNYDGYFYATRFYGDGSNIIGVNYANSSGVSTSVIGGIASVTQLSVSGVSTFGGITTHTAPLFGTQASFTGVVTASSFSGNATSATFATNAGIATNLKGGVAGNVPYQSATDTTTFVNNGISGQVLLFNGSIPIWGNVSAASGAFGGIAVYDEGNLVGTAGSIIALNFVSPNLLATATSGASGIATITMADNLVGTGLSISGISTFGDIVNALAFYGDGSNLSNTNGFSTALSSDPASPLYRIYKETRRLNVTAGIHTVSSDSDHDNLAFTKADIIVVSSGATFEVSSGTTFRTNIIDLFPADEDLDVTAQNLNVLGISTFNGNVNVVGDARVGINTSQGVILTSPNGTQYRLIVDDFGNLSTTAV